MHDSSALPDQRRVKIATVSSKACAQALVARLQEHVVPAHLEKGDAGWSIFVAPTDRALACVVCDQEPPDPRVASRPRNTLRRTARTLALGLAAAASGAVAAVAFASEPEPVGQSWTSSERTFQSDDDHDGIVDRMVVRGQDRVPTAVWHDDNHDGVIDRILRVHPHTGNTEELLDDDGDGFPDRMRSSDETGTVEVDLRPRRSAQ
ncbi:MAG: hypothetical protein AAGF12_02955 [Myxococcota bacterium]